MAVHFTYEPNRPEGDIRQGDLLEITDDLRQILDAYHPHYASNPDYPYLIVTTQSCDLACRDGKCASRYISLAAVRPLETLLEQELQRQSTSSLEQNLKVFPESKKPWLQDFTAKLLNNNLPGYFYLEPESVLGIDKPYVAYLALSIAIKSEHYQTCEEARFAGLGEIFRAKLGWLVGNMYSRVATPDWLTAKSEYRDDFEHKIHGIVDDSALWVPVTVFDRLKAEQSRRRRETGHRSYRLTRDEIRAITEEYVTEKMMRQRKLTEFIVEETAKVIRGIDPTQLRELESKLLNNPTLQALID